MKFIFIFVSRIIKTPILVYIIILGFYVSNRNFFTAYSLFTLYHPKICNYYPEFHSYIELYALCTIL